jgi:branched-chain amino acid transport system ATP-binding protein
MTAPLLELRDVSVAFGGIKAVNGVSFTVAPGEIFSIIGPNGAGKTTTFNLISRLYTPTAGRILFRGADITALSAHRAARLGIGRTFQNIELFVRGTVLDNLLLGREIHRSTNFLQELLFLPKVAAQERRFRGTVDGIIDFLALTPHRDTPVGRLPYGVRKVVELGRALAMDPTLLLLDEPSSGLNDHDTEVMEQWIQEIRRRRAIAMIIVEHDMNLVSAVSDRVLVLDAGSAIAEGSAAAVQADPAVIRAYLGE